MSLCTGPGSNFQISVWRRGRRNEDAGESSLSLAVLQIPLAFLPFSLSVLQIPIASLPFSLRARSFQEFGAGPSPLSLASFLLPSLCAFLPSCFPPSPFSLFPPFPFLYSCFPPFPFPLASPFQCPLTSFLLSLASLPFRFLCSCFPPSLSLIEWRVVAARLAAKMQARAAGEGCAGLSSGGKALVLP